MTYKDCMTGLTGLRKIELLPGEVGESKHIKKSLVIFFEERTRCALKVLLPVCLVLDGARINRNAIISPQCDAIIVENKTHPFVHDASSIERGTIVKKECIARIVGVKVWD